MFTKEEVEVAENLNDMLEQCCILSRESRKCSTVTGK